MNAKKTRIPDALKELDRLFQEKGYRNYQWIDPQTK